VPSLGRWGVDFLRNSDPERFERNARANLRLALHSLAVMRELRADPGIRYGHTEKGTLRVFRDAAAIERSMAWARGLVGDGLRFDRLMTDQAVALEPALAPVAKGFVGAIHYPGDESGNAYAFCVGLAEAARRRGVEFRYDTRVTGFRVRGREMAAIQTSAGLVRGDRYVVAAASHSTPLLRPLGVRVPVRPVKGYSVTYEVPRDQPVLGVPVVDDALHAVVVPLEGAVRVAGTAEFTGFDLAANSARIGNLTRMLDRVLPEARIDRATARPWCGLRPVSVDGVPIIGPTPISNLWINTGHGHLGWTLAAGSADVFADLISGTTPRVDAKAYELSRFG
jgi:D-amino-acid dehydrogenase